MLYGRSKPEPETNVYNNMQPKKRAYRAPILRLIPLNLEREVCTSLDSFDDNGDYEWDY